MRKDTLNKLRKLNELIHVHANDITSLFWLWAEMKDAGWLEEGAKFEGVETRTELSLYLEASILAEVDKLTELVNDLNKYMEMRQTVPMVMGFRAFGNAVTNPSFVTFKSANSEFINAMIGNVNDLKNKFLDVVNKTVEDKTKGWT